MKLVITTPWNRIIPQGYWRRYKVFPYCEIPQRRGTYEYLWASAYRRGASFIKRVRRVASDLIIGMLKTVTLHSSIPLFATQGVKPRHSTALVNRTLKYEIQNYWRISLIAIYNYVPSKRQLWTLKTANFLLNFQPSIQSPPKILIQKKSHQDFNKLCNEFWLFLFLVYIL